MKRILMLLVVPAYVLLVAGFTCNESVASTGEPGKASFWTKNKTGETYYLYVDNVRKGQLPYIPDSLTTPGSNAAQKQGLSLNLKPGSYGLAAKDGQGNVYCKGTLLLKRTENNTEIKSSWENDKCMVEVVYAN